MSLSKEQYDSIMLGYMQKQDRNRHELVRRRDEVYDAVPGYRALDESVPKLGMQLLKARIQHKSDKASGSSSVNTQSEFSKISSEKKALLLSNGYPEDYLDPIYDCADCHDTGYINGVKCHCFRQKEVACLYAGSHLSELTSMQNFSSLSEIWYTGEDLLRFRKAEKAAKCFVESFDTEFHNLLFHGTVGTGKSFLSVCIAQKLIEKGHPVIYFSSADMVDRISALSFDYRYKDQLGSLLEDLYDCDLLIIDDLGTEMLTNLISPRIFTLINERLLRRKSTIISTNLSHKELQDRYTDRIFSRLASEYDFYEFSGRDIRLQKKIMSKHNIQNMKQ